jgi:phosphoribosyl 1,2-cyclic phosphate phosphodiesterase
VRVTLLGCGSSGGVPLVGNQWGACDPHNPKNRRLRVSLLLEKGDKRVLVDSSPDMRQQLLSAGTGSINAIIYTHDHADHVHGIDDFRWINRNIGAAVPAFGARSAMASIQRRFSYAFESKTPGHGFYKPCLVPNEVTGPFRAAGIDVLPFEQNHGRGTTLGLRFGRIAYSTDVVELSEAAFKVLEGVETWIVDCYRYEAHPTHAHLETTLSWIERVRPKRAVLTHMTNALDYDELSSQLPDGVEPGYDGLVIELPD